MRGVLEEAGRLVGMAVAVLIGMLMLGALVPFLALTALFGEIKDK